MIQSMTGYGNCVAEYNGKKIHVEIKSLNSKTLDLSMRVAPLYREKELELRTLIAKQLERGKVDFTLWVEKDEEQMATPINAELMGAYYQQLKTICKDKDIPEPNDWMTVLLRMPDVLTKIEVEVLAEDEWEVINKAVEKALNDLVAFRKQEGVALAAKLQGNIDRITELLKSIEPYEKGRTEKIRAQIVDKLQNLAGVDYDKNRLEQEMIYYIEKLDINEEKQRLTNHLHYFVDTMADGHGQGKKLGFIAQEMGREINTTGSKSNNAEMQNIVVKMKDELEQIKEQVFNVL